MLHKKRTVGRYKDCAFFSAARLLFSQRILVVSALGMIFSTGLVRAQWTGTDIGAVGKAGSDSYNSTTGVYTLKGSGSDIWGNADAFHFVYQTLSNDGELVARVVSILK